MRKTDVVFRAMLASVIRDFLPRFTESHSVLWPPAGEPAPSNISFGGVADLVVDDAVSGYLFAFALVVPKSRHHRPCSDKQRDKIRALATEIHRRPLIVNVLPQRSDHGKYADTISWGTYVWCSDAPDHTIHYDDTPVR